MKRLAQLPDMASGPSRLGGAEHPAWFMNGKEFAHLQAPDRMDLRVPRAGPRSVKHEPGVMLRDHPSEWMEVRLESPEA